MSEGRRCCGQVVVGLGIVCMVGAGGCVDGVPVENGAAAGGLEVTSVPTRAHLVSGGTCLCVWSSRRTPVPGRRW